MPFIRMKIFISQVTDLDLKLSMSRIFIIVIFARLNYLVKMRGGKKQAQ